MNLLDIIPNRPLTELPEDKPACPLCAADGIDTLTRETTLVGSFPDETGYDRNHNWHSLRCQTCHFPFTREHKGANVWYTTTSHEGMAIAISGIPSCFERYAFNCVNGTCGGSVIRHYENLDGTPAKYLRVTVITKEPLVRNYRTVYTCNMCGNQAEGMHDNYMKDAGL